MWYAGYNSEGESLLGFCDAHSVVYHSDSTQEPTGKGQQYY